MSTRSSAPSALIVALALCGGSVAHAKAFQNSYVSFEVPDDWACAQEGVAWTCTPAKPPESKEAVIVLAAKVAGAEDTIPNFVNYLREPKRITTKVGTPMPSQVMYAQPRQLAGNTWVQAQHVSSEIQDYYTLYLATVKEQLAILVSFSADKVSYQKYNGIFDKALKTLKITADQHVLFPKGRTVNKNDLVGIQVPGPAAGPLGDVPINLPGVPKQSQGAVFYGLILIAAVVIFVVLRRRPKKRKPSSRPKSPRR